MDAPKAYTFDDLVTIAGPSNMSMCNMDRTSDVQEKYVRTLQSRPSDFDFYTYIFNNNEAWVIKLNDFPYNVCDGIDHYILWIRDCTMTLLEYKVYIQNIINNELNIFNTLNESNNLVWFINSPEFRSVKSIFHAHIFIRACAIKYD